jgi:hypothetical protein
MTFWHPTGDRAIVGLVLVIGGVLLIMDITHSVRHESQALLVLNNEAALAQP